MNDEIKKANTHGGKRAGAGKKPLGDQAMKSRTVRLTDEQYRKFKLIGGISWLRDILGE